MTAILALCTLAVSGCGLQVGPKAPFEAKVAETFICNTYSGEVLVVNMDVKNTSKEYVDGFTISYGVGATIDGTALAGGWLDNASENYLNSDIKIPAGEEAKVQSVFELGGKAEGEVTLLGLTYDLNTGKQVEFLNEKIDLTEVEKKVTESQYGLTIDNVLKTDDGDGNDLLVLDMTFTNNSNEATSFGSALELEIFQNGTALKSGYLPYDHPGVDDELEGNTYLDIQGGGEIKVREVYTLNDPSASVEVKAVEWSSYDAAPLLEKEIQIQ